MIGLIQQLVDFLRSLEGFDFLDRPLPVINRSISDIVGLADDFEQLLTQLQDDPGRSLQFVEEQIEDLLGIPDLAGDPCRILDASMQCTDLNNRDSPLIDFEFDNSLGREALQLNLALDRMVSRTFALDVDLASLGLDAVSNIVDISGESMIALEAGAGFQLSLGLDVSDPLLPRPFLYDFNPTDDSGTYIALTAGGVADPLDFSASIGPLGAFIRNGRAGITLGGPGDTQPAEFTVRLNDNDGDGRHYFDEGIGALLGDISFDLTGQSGSPSCFDLPPLSTGLGWLRDIAGPNSNLPDGQITLDDVPLTIVPGNDGLPDSVQLNLSLGDTIEYTVPLDFGLSLPGLGLEVDADARVILDFALALGLGVSRANGPYIDVSAPNELTVSLTVDILGAQATGQLGFLQLDVTDNGSSLTGAFTVDLRDPRANDGLLTFAELASASISDIVDFSFDASANVDLHLLASFDGNANFPSIRTDFQMGWGFGTLQSEDEFPPSPRIEFTNVQLNLGQLVSGFAGELLGQIQSVTQPLQPVIDVLTAPIPVLSDLSGSDVTLLDLGRLYGQVEGVIEFLDVAAFIIDLVNSIPAIDDDNWISLGGFTVGGDVATGASSSPLDPAPGNRSELQAADLEDLDTLLSGLETAEQQATSEWISDLRSEGGGISFPLFDDPMQNAFKLLLGQDISLFEVELPRFHVGFSYRQSFPVPGISFLAVELGGGVQVDFTAAFGYDTTGLRQFFITKDAVDIFNGFYVVDLPGPEVSFRGGISAGLSVSLAIAEVGARGGLNIVMEFDLKDEEGVGKVRLPEFTQGFPFDVTGKIFADLSVFAKVTTPPFEGSYTLAEITLLEFTVSQTPPCTPELASMNSGQLTLHAGDVLTRNFCDDRDLEIDEVFHITVSPTEGSVVVEAFGERQTFFNVTQIFADMGIGNDRVTISDGLSVPVELHGGPGDDHFFAGGGPVEFYGDGGNDQLVGAGQEDRLFGGGGPDYLEGGADDDEQGFELTDFSQKLDGGTGDDEIHGGLFDDIIVGGGGDDRLFGKAGNDIIDAGPGDDYVVAGPGDDQVYLGPGDDWASGGMGNDWIVGADGDDIIAGNEDSDVLWGGSARLEMADFGIGILNPDPSDLFDNAPASDIFVTIFGQQYETGFDRFSVPEPLRLMPTALLGQPVPGAPDDGRDLLRGGGDTDWLFGDDTIAVLQAGDDELGVHAPLNLRALAARSNDFVAVFDGGPGDDVLRGTPGRDRLDGGSGSGVLWGYDGSDRLWGDGGSGTPGNHDVLYGGRGDYHAREHGRQ